MKQEQKNDAECSRVFAFSKLHLKKYVLSNQRRTNMQENRIPSSSLSERETMPLPGIEANEHPANQSLQAYYQFYRLDWMEATKAAGLLMLVGWRMLRASPVKPIHALRIRETLYRLTGVPYTGPIPTWLTQLDHPGQKPYRSKLSGRLQ
jgi:hypothetical protein